MKVGDKVLVNAFATYHIANKKGVVIHLSGKMAHIRFRFHDSNLVAWAWNDQLIVLTKKKTKPRRTTIWK